MSGQAPNDIDTASSRKDAVRKAFNQEYMATQEAMSQAAERARTQVLDQRYTISAHAQDVKAGATAPQPPVGAQQGGAKAASAPPQGAPYMGAGATTNGTHQVMFDIANEIRNIINLEVDQRMQILAARVEAAILQSLPTEPAGTPDTPAPSSSAKGQEPPAQTSPPTGKT